MDSDLTCSEVRLRIMRAMHKDSSGDYNTAGNFLAL